MTSRPKGVALAVVALLSMWACPATGAGIVGSKIQAKPGKFQFQSKDTGIASPAGSDVPTVAG